MRQNEEHYSPFAAVGVVNGRRAELEFSDERRLPRVICSLEQPGRDADVAISVCVTPVDMRKQAATEVLLVEQGLKRNICEPVLYVFTITDVTKSNRFWQRNGLCLWGKWLEGALASSSRAR